MLGYKPTHNIFEFRTIDWIFGKIYSMKKRIIVITPVHRRYSWITKFKRWSIFEERQKKELKHVLIENKYNCMQPKQTGF